VAHRNRKILDNPMKFPWWVSAILAGAVYVLSVYVLPGVTLASPILRDLPSGIARVGPTLSLLLLIVAAVSALFQFRRGRLLERKTGHGSVGALSWRQFVSQVSEAFSRKGFMVLNYLEGGPHGAVNIWLRKNGQVLFVQCKHWKAKSVGAKAVRELYGIMTAESVRHGVIVTYGSFTPEAIKFARANSIALIDGPQLTRMIASVQQSGEMQAQQEAARSCPLCGSKMVPRIARNGPYAGKKFWGCSKFPDCRGLVFGGD